MPFDSEIPARSRDLIVLEKARERIARGWCQQVRHNTEGAVCIVGALQDAAGIPEGTNRDIYAATAPWTDPLGFSSEGFDFPDTWNDALGRTQAEVLARFDAAIAKLEKNDGE